MLKALRSLSSVVGALAVVVCCTKVSMGQNSSLFQNPLPDFRTVVLPQVTGANQPSGSTPESGALVSPLAMNAQHMASASWTFTPPPPPHVLKVHDVVSVRVDEISRMTSEGRATQRKNGSYDAILKEWLSLEGLKAIRKAPQSSGDPAVSAQVSETFRATSDLQTREALTFNIAAEITDIRPNGNIVLEAHKTISNNDNRWEASLSGICQASDIGPDNVILSRDILHLTIDKRESGQARDGYRRAWFQQIFSRLQPF